MAPYKRSRSHRHVDAPTTAAIPLRSAVAAGLAGPVLALALGVGVVAAAASSPYAGDHGYVAPAISALGR